MSNNFSIRPVPDKDHPHAWQIYATAFVESGRWPERQREYCAEQVSQLLGCYDGSELVGLTAVIDFEIRLGDRWVPCAGIAGVAMLPSHRRLGLVKLMLTECLREQHEKRVPIASLWPFSYPFYKRMGWEVCGFRTEIDVPIGAVPQMGCATAYKIVSLDNFAGAAEAHDQWTEVRTNLGLRRTAKRWKWELERPGEKQLLFVHADGYLWLQLDVALEKKKLVVKEWVYNTRAALLDGLSFLANMDSQYTSVEWMCPDAEPFLQLINHEPPPAVRVLPGMMSRVVHVEAFQEALPVKSDGLKVIDPLGVSGPVEGDGVGPGEIIQHVTGLWKNPDQRLPEALYRVCGALPSLCLERY